MRYSPRTQTFRGSATDLANHARCTQLTQLARAREIDIAEGRAEQVVPDGLALRKGREFEAAYVAERRAEVEAAGGRFVDVMAAAGSDRATQRDLLAQAMRDGVELIAQAPLNAGSVTGIADLLVRVADADTPAGTLDTPHRYEPLEIKYGRSLRPAYVLQVCAYADALEALQGALPQHVHVLTGDRALHSRVTADFIEYFRASRTRFAAALEFDLDAELARVPEPVTHCAACDFTATCDAQRRGVDHLALVANIRVDQRAKLASVGIDTLEQLATVCPERVPGIGATTLPRLVMQARLQLEARTSGELPGVAYRKPANDEPTGRGFALLPAPDADDMFFDFEGYPYHEAGALEYLWGWSSNALPATPGALRFDYLWADTVEEEAVAFSRFLDEVEQRRERSPGMHVFHYAPYEVTALNRLARAHPHEMERLDVLLRAGVFVDLYAVVRQAMQVGTESYSIKKLEPLYGFSREGDELADGGASIEFYEGFLTSGDSGVRDAIIDYNRQDCDSTLRLRDWLLHHRDLAGAGGITWPAAPDGDSELPDVDGAVDPADDAPREPTERDLLMARLEAVADDEGRDDDVRLAARLLSAMPGWQWRSRREFFGDLHARARGAEPDDYLDEPTAIAGLTLVDTEPTGKGSTLRTYAFPPQVTLVKVKQVALDVQTVRTLGTVMAVDFEANTVAIKTTPSQQRALDDSARRWGDPTDAAPRAFIGWTDIRVTTLEAAAARVAAQFLAALDAGRDPFGAGERCAPALSILARHAPRPNTGSGPEALTLPPDPAELAGLVQRLTGSHLVVQGPPGTGKTWTSARLVVALVEAGLRVGISSNSHSAVINVLEGIDRYRAERAADGRPIANLNATYGLRDEEKSPGDLTFGAGWIERPKDSKASAARIVEGESSVIAGTAWQFAREELELDVALVDEAGQVSLLHGTAMASCTKRVVLVGDPQQLPQPSDAQHPHGCGASVLEHLFAGEAVLPPERGVLLPVTRRLHPSICSFISESYYAGALHPFSGTDEHRVSVPGLDDLTGSGIRLLEVAHSGNRSSSPEEAEAIRACIADLLRGGIVVDRAGAPERALRPSDIIVVAPYNAQRRLLELALPDGVAVGTVDKFQGQEAAVAIVSLTASSRDDLPRGLEFLLDPHRLNVAVSRARALAIVVTSPSLLATNAESVDEMALLNDLARYARTSAPTG